MIHEMCLYSVNRNNDKPVNAAKNKQENTNYIVFC